jgi:hypothetical protein
MDGRRFDRITRMVTRPTTRRAAVRGLVAAIAAQLVGAPRVAARQGDSLGAGDTCYDDSQCAAADAALVCADNGFDYDGPFNCCAGAGGACDLDEGCCGTLVCVNGMCGGLTSSAYGVGSISVQGRTCPTTWAAPEACDYTDEIFAADIVLSGPGGMTLSLADGTSHAVSHVWDGVPYGTYYFQALGADPIGYRLERIEGTTIVAAGVEGVVVDADNPTDNIDFVYVPVG